MKIRTAYLFITAAVAAVFMSCNLTDDDENALKWRNVVDIPINWKLNMGEYSQFIRPDEPGAGAYNSDIANAPNIAGEIDTLKLFEILGIEDGDTLDPDKLSEYFDKIDSGDSQIQDMLFEYFGYQNSDTLFLDLFSGTFDMGMMGMVIDIEDFRVDFSITIDNKCNFGAVLYVLFAPDGSSIADMDVNGVYKIVTASDTSRDYVNLLPGGLVIASGGKPKTSTGETKRLFDMLADNYDADDSDSGEPAIYSRWLAKITIRDLKEIVKLSGDNTEYIDARLRFKVSGVSKI